MIGMQNGISSVEISLAIPQNLNRIIIMLPSNFTSKCICKRNWGLQQVPVLQCSLHHWS